ncbi:TonB-dependent receptor [Candidatus Marinimicrobia bacterium]|nr:TonB-dependent receptor [Candidatus Neomarinimicrobiota bacterium]
MKHVTILIGFFSLVFAQTTISGVVTDINSNPVADANIVLSNGFGTTSDNDGSFAFTATVPTTATFSAIGFADKSVTVSGGSVSVELSNKPVALDAIDVLVDAASITSGMFLRSVRPSSVVSESELRQFNHTDIHRVVSRIPGVYVQEEDGLGLRPNIGIRGTGLERMEKLNVMEDGIIIAPAPYASPAAYYSPTMGRMQGLEIRKGSTQIKHGPFTTGGSLNYISTAIPSSSLNSVDFMVGSFGKTVLHVKSGNTMGQWGYLFEVYNDMTDGFKELDGGGDSGYSKTDVMAKVRYSMNANHAVEMKVSMTDEISDETYLGLSDDDYTTNPLRRYRASQLDEMDADHSQFVLSYAGKLSDNLTMAVSAYNNEFARNWYKLNKVDGLNLGLIADPAGNAAAFALMDAMDSDADAYRIKANNREYLSRGVQAVLNWSIENHDIQAGLRIHADEMDRFQWEDRYQMVGGKLNMTTAATPGTDSNRIDSAEATSLYVEDRMTSGNFIVTGGLRYEEITVKREDWGKTDPTRAGDASIKEDTFDVIVPGVSVEYALEDGTTLGYGIHKGFAPHGPGGTKVVDGVTQEVKSEESWNHEWTVRSYEGLNGLELTFFMNKYDNLLGADTAATGGTGSNELYNGGAVDVSGLELYLRRMLMDNGSIQLPIEIAYTKTNTEFRESFDGFWGDVSRGDELPYIPETMVSVNLGVNMDKTSVNIGLKHNSAARTTAGSGRLDDANSTDALTVIDLGVKHSLQNNITLSMGIKNLLDKDAVVARRPYGARPTMPRSISLGVNYNF